MTSSPSITPGERGAAPAEFDPTYVSPSRIDKYLGCGVAFKRQYIDGEKPTQSGSAALFGNVMHAAAEKWSLNRGQSLVSLVSQAWLEVGRGTPIEGFVTRYQHLSIEALREEKRIRDEWAARGKESKAPRMTADFKKSEVAGKINRLLGEWIPKLNEGSPWKFTERDPLPSLYDESLILGKRYALKYWSLPASLHTEFGFTVPWKGFLLRGFIDCIDPVLTEEGELRGYAITDYKTYRAEAPGAKDHRQATIYDIAFELLVEEGVLPFDPELPVWVVFDYMRLLKRKDFVLGEADRAVLEADLGMYLKGVQGGVFLPAQKNSNPDFCDYPDCCLRSRGEGTGCRGDLYPEES